jgi:formamidopyrimidine-DNA glycosylase
MPELPEVEVTRRQIEKILVGRTVLAVDTTKKSYFFLTPPAELRVRLVGRQTKALTRVGKYLVAELDDGSRLLLHLGMTGQLFAAGARSPRLLSAERRATLSPERAQSFEPDQHTHLVMRFAEPGPNLYFRDVRKFGKVAWIAHGEAHERLDKLGVDALRVSGSELHAAIRRRAAPIKSVLLDQGVLAGVGNIYADEALFLAKIRSRRPAKRLRPEECERLAAAIRRVLRRSIARGGSSIDDYVRPDGSDGAYQTECHVYGRGGEPCRICKTPIKRIVIGGRSTHYCPTCQK